MCGIAGFIGPGNAATLAAMSQAIRHRGPDDDGLWLGEGVGLAHRRLAIIDLSPGGHQPMFSPQGDVLVFNGEIYNFQELRRELEVLGHRFVSQSDSEVILQAWRQWGEDCVKRLRGMFAFVLWDAGKRRLFAARDRVGIKPFYYLEHGGVFYFASEVKALLQIPGYVPRLNSRLLPLYLTFRYTPGDETLFAGVKKLPPAHTLTLSAGGRAQLSRYWELIFEPDDEPSEAQWRERFWGVFEEAVQQHMLADVPLGAYLSGGLDSSLIVAAMAANSARPVDAFSVGFRDEKANELPYARQVAQHFACRHHILHAEDEAAAVLDPVIYHLDEPLADLATIPTYLMARATKPHVTVVLSGEGADEILAGYAKYRAFLFGRKTAGFLPAPLWGLASRQVGNLSLQRALASQAESDPARAYLNLAAVFSRTELKTLLTPAAARAMMPADEIEALVRHHLTGQPDLLSGLLALDFHTWLPDDLLLKNDRMTMAHAVEARVPYLDHQLIELCARIPSRFKLRWNQEKVLLRKVMAGRLPENICRRKKAGFTVPLADWCQGEFKARLNGVFAAERKRQGEQLFSPREMEKLQAKPLQHPYYRRQFWSVATLELWRQRFGIEN